MKKDLNSTIKALEDTKKQSKKGVVYWMGRDIQKIFGYSSWQNFGVAANRARMACESTGEDTNNHFIDTIKKVPIGSEAMVSRKDYFLDRYACYLIAMNGDSSKPEIGTAQTYFAIQTRRQELQDELTAGERRIELRDRVKSWNKSLMATAQKAGVQKFAIFHDAGYRGLYEMGLEDIRKEKGLPPNANLLDYAGRTELAANGFRLTQTEEKIIREGIKGEQKAINAHHDVAKKVRATIDELGGTMPEELPAEVSIKKLAGNLKKIDKELTEETSV